MSSSLNGQELMKGNEKQVASDDQSNDQEAKSDINLKASIADTETDTKVSSVKQNFTNVNGSSCCIVQ